jgi:hypothetical protein
MIYNSVKDIKDYCYGMIQTAKDYDDRIDISYALQDLSASLNVLVGEYANETYDEDKIKHLKELCEKDALNLEYSLMRVCDKYKYSYLMRSKVIELDEEIKALIPEVFRQGNKQAISYLMGANVSLEDIVEKVVHIKFELSDDDVEMLDVVKETVEQVNKMLGRDIE